MIGEWQGSNAKKKQKVGGGYAPQKPEAERPRSQKRLQGGIAQSCPRMA